MFHLWWENFSFLHRFLKSLDHFFFFLPHSKKKNDISLMMGTFKIFVILLLDLDDICLSMKEFCFLLLIYLFFSLYEMLNYLLPDLKFIWLAYHYHQQYHFIFFMHYIGILLLSCFLLLVVYSHLQILIIHVFRNMSGINTWTF